MKTFLIDANIFLRFFVKENENEYKISKKILDDAKEGNIKLIVPQIIIFEVNYTLSKYYGFARERVAEVLSSIVNSDFLEIDSREIFLLAIDKYKHVNMDLTDLFLAEKANKENLLIKTFDKKLEKYAKDC